ncbi:hypothetical protein GCM10028822_12500 [Hymenobacter terrigena]
MFGRDVGGTALAVALGQGFAQLGQASHGAHGQWLTVLPGGAQGFIGGGKGDGGHGKISVAGGEGKHRGNFIT